MNVVHRSFAEVLDRVATIGAVQKLRQEQEWAGCRGTNLSADQVVEIFNAEYQRIHEAIQRTTTVTVQGVDVSEPRLP